MSDLRWKKNGNYSWQLNLAHKLKVRIVMQNTLVPIKSCRAMVNWSVDIMRTVSNVSLHVTMGLTSPSCQLTSISATMMTVCGRRRSTGQYETAHVRSPWCVHTTLYDLERLLRALQHKPLKLRIFGAGLNNSNKGRPASLAVECSRECFHAFSGNESKL